MFCGPGCPHWATGPMILIHIRYIRSHLKPLSGQVYKCVWAPWAKINSFQVGWDVVFHAVALASCVLVEDGKSNTTSRNHEWCQCETVTKREFLRAQFGIVVCCCWSYIFGLVSPGFQIFWGYPCDNLNHLTYHCNFHNGHVSLWTPKNSCVHKKVHQCCWV